MNASHDEHPNATSRLKSVLPILEWLQGYQKDWLRPDIVAGLTAAAVVLPKAIGIRDDCRSVLIIKICTSGKAGGGVSPYLYDMLRD